MHWKSINSHPPVEPQGEEDPREWRRAPGGDPAPRELRPLQPGSRSLLHQWRNHRYYMGATLPNSKCEAPKSRPLEIRQ